MKWCEALSSDFSCSGGPTGLITSVSGVIDVVPMTAALALFARENGAGAMFEAEPQLDKMPSTDDDAGDAPEASPEKSSTTRKRPNLKVIK